MATTIRQTQTSLTIGEQTDTVTLIPADERLTLRLTSTQVGTDDSQARMTVLDSLGRVKKTVLLFGSGVKDVGIDEIEGNLQFYVECSAGTCFVQVDEVTGLEEALGSEGDAISGGDLQDGSVTTAKLAAGVLTADAAGRLKMADDFVVTAKILDDNVTTAKILDANVTEAKLAAGAHGYGVDGIQIVADPGDAGTIVPPSSGSFRCNITTAGVETRVLGAPAFIGQVAIIFHEVAGGSFTMNNAGGWLHEGVVMDSDVATFDSIAEVMTCVSNGDNAASQWDAISSNGVVFS